MKGRIQLLLREMAMTPSATIAGSFVRLPSLPASDRGEVSRYLADIRKFPLLTAEEEITLARALRDRSDANAAYKLVTSHLRLAAAIAMRYRGYGLPLADLISEANLGLMHAVKRFDPEKGFRLTTYALWWIRASVQEYVLRSWSLVKLGTTSAQKKLFFNLKRLKSKLLALDGAELRTDQAAKIAEDLGVRAADVHEMDRRLRSDLSLNVRLDDDEGSSEWQDLLADPSSDPEEQISERDERERRQRLLREALQGLSAREQSILRDRFLSEQPKTLDELSRVFKVSRERIRQIEERALQKLRARLTAEQTPPVQKSARRFLPPLKMGNRSPQTV